MMIMRNLLIYVSIFLFSLSLSAQDLTILHLNDTHSHIEPERNGLYAGMGGVIEQAAYIDSVRTAEGASNVLLLHAGDFNQGTSYFTELGGAVEVDVLNAMSFDAVCLGNHEFDNGLEDLAARVRKLNMPVLCANYDFTSTPLEGLVYPYVIIEKAGRRIGIFGLLTDLTVVVKAEIAALLKYTDPAAAASSCIAMLEDAGCDMIVALTHLGSEGEFYTDCELAANTSGIDVIVGGHSHTFLDDKAVLRDKNGKKVVYVTDGKWGVNIGKLTVK